MAINSPFGTNSIFDPSFEWMGDKKEDKSKSLSIKFLGIEPENTLNKRKSLAIILNFEVTSKNLEGVNAKVHSITFNAVIPINRSKELPYSIPKNGSKNIQIKVPNSLAGDSSLKIEVIITCDGISASTGKFRIESGGDDSGKCFCLDQGLANISCNGNGTQTTENLYKELANELGVEHAIFFAIAKQESQKAPFIQDIPRKATILLERHYVYKLIKKKYGEVKANYYKNLNPNLCHNNISPKGTYGTYLEQLTRLEQVKIWDFRIAIQSCSWGKFQIMGEYLTDCNLYKDAEEFETAMNQCELQHFQYFRHFIKNVKGNKLISAMKNKNFVGIAEGYNGSEWKSYNPHYAENIKKYYEDYNK